MKVTVFGWNNSTNVGDDSYRISFPLLFPNVDFSFANHLTGEEELCVLGGGSICKTEFLDEMDKVKRKMAMSISIVGNDPCERLASYESIYVRDMRSMELLAEKGIQGHYLPDFAFAMTPDRKNGQKIIKEYIHKQRVDKHDKKVAIVFNSYLLGHDAWTARNATNFDKVVWSLADIFDNTNANFIFIPFCTLPPSDDRVTNAWLSGRCKWFKKNVVIYENLGPQATLDVISATDAVVSSRLHSTIFSCISNRPFVDITHHDKNLNFLETIYKSEWSVSYWNFDAKKCANLLDGFLKDPKQVQNEISFINDSLQSALTKAKNVRFV